MFYMPNAMFGLYILITEETFRTKKFQNLKKLIKQRPLTWFLLLKKSIKTFVLRGKSLISISFPKILKSFKSV